MELPIKLDLYCCSIDVTPTQTASTTPTPTVTPTVTPTITPTPSSST